MIWLICQKTANINQIGPFMIILPWENGSGIILKSILKVYDRGKYE